MSLKWGRMVFGGRLWNVAIAENEADSLEITENIAVENAAFVMILSLADCVGSLEAVSERWNGLLMADGGLQFHW
jgi:hypothetical protein